MSRCMNCSSPTKRVNTRSQKYFAIIYLQLPLFFFIAFQAAIFERCLNASLFFLSGVSGVYQAITGRACRRMFKRTQEILWCCKNIYVYPIVSPLFHGLRFNPLLIVGRNRQQGQEVYCRYCWKCIRYRRGWRRQSPLHEKSVGAHHA
jgi:hypothetical protein